MKKISCLVLSLILVLGLLAGCGSSKTSQRLIDEAYARGLKEGEALALVSSEVDPLILEADSSVEVLSAYENHENVVERILAETNRYRKEAGLKPLQLYRNGGKGADIRATEATKVWSHSRPDGREYYSAYEYIGKESSDSYRMIGENLAKGTYGAFSPESIVEGWMNSPGHRANILRPEFTHLSIGFYADEADGVSSYVQSFFGNTNFKPEPQPKVTTKATEPTVKTTEAKPGGRVEPKETVAKPAPTETEPAVAATTGTTVATDRRNEPYYPSEKEKVNPTATTTVTNETKYVPKTKTEQLAGEWMDKSFKEIPKITSGQAKLDKDGEVEWENITETVLDDGTIVTIKDAPGQRAVHVESADFKEETVIIAGWATDNN